MAAYPPGETISFGEAVSHLPPKLSRVVAARFPGETRRATSLAGAFLALKKYDRRFAQELVVLGRDRRASWNLRLLAAMMLANQCLRLARDAAAEFTSVIVSLRLMAPDASAVDADVLRQGYTSTELPEFRAQFLRHLGRLERLYRRLRGFNTAAEAFDDFILISRDPCKVPLARCLFAPAEVVERVVQQLQVSSGLRSPLEEPGEREAQRYWSHLPAYEREIVRLLTDNADIYWSCERTSSEINPLLEKPIGAVACVVKPPGSALEFEIKRTGIGGAFPLGAVYTGVNGNPVPPSHRLHGGASAASLRWESNHSAILSEVYRVAHHREAPISKLLTLASFRTVPCRGRDVHLLDYFTDPEIFGSSHQKMRREMKRCVCAYDQQFGADFADLPGEAGLTGRFLYHVLPAQGLLAQTSSYRLDILARYFSSAGAESYFQHGLKRESQTSEEARRFADALLEEVLGIYVAPGTTYVDYARYLAAAFAVPENRRQADRMHTQAVSDLGQLWGTILALGGFTYGESFVGRNLGLKSVFADGEWTSRLLSMDHDNLHLPDHEEEVFWAQGALRIAVQDECYIRGNPGRPKQVPRCALHHLQQIYHVESDDAPAKSRRALESAMGRAYHQTRRALESETQMRRLFSMSYLRHLRDWHAVVADYLVTVPEGDAAEFKAWKNRTEVYLTERKYDKIVENYCRALEKHSDFVRRYSFLYLPAAPL
jgi:tetratricopeptide (TPR) repeat protein